MKQSTVEALQLLTEAVTWLRTYPELFLSESTAAAKSAVSQLKLPIPHQTPSCLVSVAVESATEGQYLRAR